MSRFPLLSPLVVAAVMFIPLISYGAACPIYVTGQVHCYSGATQIDCTGTGQDGDMRAGVPWPNPRFDTLAEGRILNDHLTGLQWTLDLANTDTGDYLWFAARDHVNALNAGGYLAGGWRLPNVFELWSLMSCGLECLVSAGFQNLGYYWSSTMTATTGGPYAFSMNPSMNINLYDSTDRILLVRNGPDMVHTLTLPRTGQVRCWNLVEDPGTHIAAWVVQSCNESAQSGEDGQLLAGFNWFGTGGRSITMHGDGTATDGLTGLMWTEDGNLPRALNPSIEGNLTWQQALDFIKAINLNKYAGYRDWRLPNINELMSLMNFDGHGPEWLESKNFKNLAYQYWSSTNESNFAYVMGLFYGQTYGDDKSNLYYVWPVRGGQATTYAYLGVAKTGDGAGLIVSDPAGISCDAATSSCTGAFYPPGTVVSLTATPAAGSIFLGWTGDADCGDGRVTVSSETTCTADFDLCAHPVLVGPYWYDSIYAGYLGAQVGDIIKVSASIQSGDLDFSSSKNVRVYGGYDCLFGSRISYTTVDGTFTVGKGSAELAYILIK